VLGFRRQDYVEVAQELVAALNHLDAAGASRSLRTQRQTAPAQKPLAPEAALANDLKHEMSFDEGKTKRGEQTETSPAGELQEDRASYGNRAGVKGTRAYT